MDKPKEIELLETFLKLQHKLGVSTEELVQKMETAVLWFVEERVKSKLDSQLEKMALPKVMEFVHSAVADEVNITLGQG